MNKKENDTVKKLNQFLKGTRMAIRTYENYIKIVHNNRLKDEIIQIHKDYLKYEQKLIRKLNSLHGKPTEGIGIIGLFSEFIQDVKNLFIDNDEQLLKRLIETTNIGIKMSNKFLEENYVENEESYNIIKDIITHQEKTLERLNNFHL